MELFKLFGTIAINANDALKELDDVTDKGEQTQSKLSGAFKKIGTAVVAGFAIGKIVDFGKSLVSLAENTREYRTEQAKLETAFEQGGFSADTARKTYEGLNAVLGDSGRSVEAVNHLAKLVDTEEELSKWTDICTGVFATFGDSLPIEGLTEAANETAKVGQVTGPLADALNWAGVNEDAFNEKLAACSSEQERQALITETLTGLYSEAAATYRTASEDIISANQAQDKLNNSLAKIGAIIEPIVAKGKMLIAEVLETAVPFIEKLLMFIDPLIVGVQTFFTEIFNVLTWLYETASQYFPDISGFFKSCVGEIVAFWKNNLAPCLKDIINFVKTVLAPIFKVVFQVIGSYVGTVFGYIRNIWNNSLKPVFKGITTFLSGVFTGNWKKAFSGIAQIVAGVVNGVITMVETMVNRVIQFVNGLIDKINTVLSKAGLPTIGKLDEITLKKIEVKESDINYGKQEAQIEDNTVDGAEIGTGSLTASLDSMTAALDSLPTDIASASSTEAATSTPSASTSSGGGGGGTYTLSESNISAIVSKIRDAIGANAPEDVTSIKDSVLGFVEKFDTHSTHLADLKSAMIGTDEESGMIGDVREMKEALLAFVEALPTVLQDAFATMKFDVDNREFARLVKAVN